MLSYALAALCAGFLLDLLLGDPPGWPHLVRVVGALIRRLEARLYPAANKRQSGALLALAVAGLSLALPCLLLFLAWRLSPWLYLMLETLLCWQVLAIKSLRVESGHVYHALAAGDLPQARRAVGRIVGRDTQALDAAGVARAAVETVAENTADGVIAPLFYLALGGAPLACLYKAVNTMDSMIGYRNARYLDFGRAAARLDDAFNYIPARLAALLLIAGAWLCGYDGRAARRVWRRDRRKHASPNAAQTEAAVAGALGLRLAGDAYYFGALHRKPYLGDDTRPIEAQDICRSQRLLYAASLLMLLLALLVRGAVLYAV